MKASFWPNIAKSVAIGIVVSLICPAGAVVATAVIGSFVSEIINSGGTEMHIKYFIRTRTDAQNQKYQKERYAEFYKYYNYTGYMGKSEIFSWETDYSGWRMV